MGKLSGKKINITKKMRFIELNITVFFVLFFFGKLKFRLGLESGHNTSTRFRAERPLFDQCAHNINVITKTYIQGEAHKELVFGRFVESVTTIPLLFKGTHKNHVQMIGFL